MTIKLTGENVRHIHACADRRIDIRNEIAELEARVLILRKVIRTELTNSALAEKYGVVTRTIEACLNGINHGGICDWLR